MKILNFEIGVPSKKLLLMNNYYVNEFLEVTNQGENLDDVDFEDGICILTEGTNVTISTKIHEDGDGRYDYKKGEFNELEIRYQTNIVDEVNLRKELACKLYMEGGQLILIDMDEVRGKNIEKEFELNSLFSLSKDSKIKGYTSNIENGSYYIYNYYDQNNKLIKTVI